MSFGPGRPLPAVVLDEIGLEGLEGITISGLWIRLSDTLELPLPLLDSFQAQVWNVIIQAHSHLQFYRLPEPREQLKLWNRFGITDPDYGLPLTLTECPYVLYKCVPISDCEILGSCETYDVRKPIQFQELEKMSIKDVENKWGDTFVIVGSQKLRYNCLIPPNVSIPSEITSTQYCVLEFIGRSRTNGVASAGQFSLLHCCRDSAIAFYIRNKLVRLGLITKQAYTEKRSDRLVSSSLLTLTRFHSQNKTAFIAIIEKIFYALKNTTNQRMAMTGIRNLFPPENQSMIKKIMLTHFFKKFFETTNVRTKDLMADLNQTSKTGADREVLCVRLKNPNITEDELFNDDDATDEKESNEFYNYKHAYVDMPLLEEIYRAIEKHGSAGCSQSQLCTILSINHLNVRQALKKAMADKVITSYCKDMGRQRTNMLVAANCSNSIKKVKEENINITKNLKCNDEPKIPPDPEPPLKDIPQITAVVKEVSNWKVNQNSRDETAKQIERKQKIVEVVNENCLLQVTILRQEIIKCEQEAGYKDEICNKSLYRTIARLQKLGIVNLIEISLQIEENARLYRYVTHPKITTDHSVVMQEVIKLKNALFLHLEERNLRNVPVRMGHTQKPKVVRLGLIPPGPHKAPKFLTARFLHEFMFYMLFELEHGQQPLELSEDLLKTWLQSEPNINFGELYKSMADEHIAPYRDRINWRTFITPLPTYENKPFGWISLPDVVERMPFSLLNKIIHVPPGVEPLAIEYLNHPVRQYYLIKQLPLNLQGLINRGRLARILVNIVRVLHRMGLIQLSEKGGKDALQLWLYFNRKATILDTTTSEAGYVKVNADREYTEIKFNFESYSDIQQYWNCLHKICIHTKLGFVHKNASRTPSRILYKLRQHELNFIVSPISSFEEAPKLDTGKPPGDCLGAGGIASALYSSFQRNWTWLVNNKHTTAATAGVQKLKKTNKYMRTKLSKIMTGSTYKKSTGTPPSMTVKKVNRFAMTSGGRVIKRKGTVIQAKPRAAFPVDSVDRDALKQMRSLRARWSIKEDLILKMTRATFLFLAVPVIHFSHRDVARITRDIIRLQCGIQNKTTQACHRRIQFLVKRNRHLPELPTWLHALQTNEHLNSRYEGEKFFRDLRELYPVKSEFRNALFVHFLYAFSQLQAQINFAEPQDNGFNKTKIPNTLSEFYKQFRECSPLNESKSLLHLNPTTKLELQLATINNVLHSSLCCVRDKTQYNLQIFKIFKTYSEDILHAAFKKARLDGLVVARKKNQIKAYTTQLTGPSYVFSNKYRLTLMFLRIPYIIFDMYHAFFDETMNKIFNVEPTTTEVKSPHSAQVFFIAELLWNNFISVNIKLPSNVLTIDPSAQQTSISASERILDHYHNVLDNAPQTEYLKQFDALGELATRVKFKAANEKYKLYYHPFDVVSKLNSIQIHFFCFLGNLNRSLDLTFSHIDKDMENVCPFVECVMKGGNYLNTIEKIINDREGALDEIHEDNHMDTDGEVDSVTVCVENLIAVFEKFETFVRARQAKEEVKDLGRITMKKKPLDLIELCKELARANDDVTNSDEYEPTLNKEERIAKAQDVFVVNLPTLQICANEEALNEIEMKEYKEIMLPGQLMETALLRDEILDKILTDTCWTYNQNNLETLKNVMNTNGFSDEEQEKVVNIHNFIESHELGAHASDLLERFPDIDFLKKAVKLLREHYLVLRAGVSSFMYVQKNNVRHWVIHTRHIKRLARESMGKLVAEAASTSQKRKHPEEENDNEETEPATKQSKSNVEGRRVSKPVERFEDRVEVKTTTLTQENDEKDLLILKPCPWIRVNGSLNRRVIDKWMASIVIECAVQNGCTVHAVCLRFKQMHAADIMFLLELMVDLKIIELRSYKRNKVGLSSKFKELEKSDGNEFTDPRNTFVVTAPDALTRMSVFIGDKLYRTEFI